MDIYMIAAMGEDRSIAKNGKIPWQIPSDLRRFKAITYHHPVIMGHNTYRSMGKILFGRKNIILTRSNNIEEITKEIIKKENQRLGVINSKVASNAAALNDGRLKFDNTSTIEMLKYNWDPDIAVCNTLTEALEACFKVSSTKTETDKIPFIIGGRQIYKLFMSIASKLFITLVHKKVKGDIRFPTIKKDEFKLVDQEKGEEDGKIKYTYLIYERKNK